MFPNPDESKSSYAIRLCANGSARLGGGCFSTVYSLPDDPQHVLKVGSGQDRDQIDGWLAYYAWLRNQSNPHLPKIDFFQWYKPAGDDRFFVARMERLSKLEVRTPASRQRQICCEILYSGGIEYMNKEDIKSLPEALLNLTLDIYKNFEGVFAFDLHDLNGMMRLDGTLVLTDPLSWPRERSSTAILP